MQARINPGSQQQGYRAKHQDTGIVGNFAQDRPLGAHPPDVVERPFDIPHAQDCRHDQRAQPNPTEGPHVNLAGKVHDRAERVL